MSTILDALRRKTGERETDHYEHTAGADSVLATLGQPRRKVSGGSPLRTLLLWGVAAVVVGFVGLSLVIVVFAPPAPSAPRLRAATAPAALGIAPATAPAGVPPAGAPVGAPTRLAPVDAPIQGTGGLLSSRASAELVSPAKDSVGGAQRTEPAVPDVAAPKPTVARRAQRPEPEPIDAPAPPPGPSPQPAPDDFGLALYFQRIGDFDAALGHYRALLEQNDGSAEVHNNLGLLYQGRDQFDSAIQQFQRAIAINPKYGKAHNNLGVALMRSGQEAQAAAEFRVALASEPRSVEALVNLALTERAAGQTIEARDLLERAVTIDPRNAGTHYNLAVAADQSGDTAIAIEHYRAFLRLRTVAPADLTTRVRARLTALGG